MKIRHKASGKIWTVDHFVAHDEHRNRVISDLDGNDYELVPDDPKTPHQSPHVEDLIMSNTRAIEHNTASIEHLNSLGEDIIKRVLSLESERKGVAEVIQSHGVELEEGLKMNLDTRARVISLESLLSNVNERLARIDGRSLVSR